MFREVRPTRWCVFISGRGSNLASLIEKPDVDVRLVVSSSPDADGVMKARRAGVQVVITPRKESGGIDWILLDQELRKHSIDAIFLLGFMRIVPASFVASWAGKILNLHPSLLPKYPGLKSIERAIEAEDEVGCTIHEVIDQVDAGPLLISRRSAGAGRAHSATETFVHIDEQRIVKEIVDIWHP